MPRPITNGHAEPDATTCCCAAGDWSTSLMTTGEADGDVDGEADAEPASSAPTDPLGADGEASLAICGD
jgi:hypothetical protein